MLLADAQLSDCEPTSLLELDRARGPKAKESDRVNGWHVQGRVMAAAIGCLRVMVDEF